MTYHTQNNYTQMAATPPSQAATASAAAALPSRVVAAPASAASPVAMRSLRPQRRARPSPSASRAGLTTSGASESKTALPSSSASAASAASASPSPLARAAARSFDLSTLELDAVTGARALPDADDAPYGVTSFDDARLGLTGQVRRGVHAMGYEEPSRVQQLALWPMLAGHDVIVQAQAGLGKTASYLIPLLDKVARRIHSPVTNGRVQAIVLVNAKNLAYQVKDAALDDAVHFARTGEMRRKRGGGVVWYGVVWFVVLCVVRV